MHTDWRRELAVNKGKLESALFQADLVHLEYRLHAVMIHAGEAGSGHYWVYIYDERSARWYKMNDTFVTQANIAEVNESSFGGEGLKSAYALVYISSASVANRFSGPGAGVAATAVEWREVIGSLQQVVEEDNLRLTREQDAWNARQNGTTLPALPASSTSSMGASSGGGSSYPAAPAPARTAASEPPLSSYQTFPTLSYPTTQPLPQPAARLPPQSTVAPPTSPTAVGSTSASSSAFVSPDTLVGKPASYQLVLHDQEEAAYARRELQAALTTPYRDDRVLRYGDRSFAPLASHPDSRSGQPRERVLGGASVTNFVVDYQMRQHAPGWDNQTEAQLRGQYILLHQWASYAAAGLELAATQTGARLLLALQYFAVSASLAGQLEPNLLRMDLEHVVKGACTFACTVRVTHKKEGSGGGGPVRDTKLMARRPCCLGTDARTPQTLSKWAFDKALTTDESNPGTHARRLPLPVLPYSPPCHLRPPSSEPHRFPRGAVGGRGSPGHGDADVLLCVVSGPNWLHWPAGTGGSQSDVAAGG